MRRVIVNRLLHILQDCFLPHEGNNHHPHALRHHVLAGYSIALIALKVLMIVLPIALPYSDLFSSAVTPQNIILLTNRTRQSHGLSLLKEDDRLARAAAARAEDMMRKQYFAHTSPTGLRAWDFIRGEGYRYLYSGENLAVHYSTAEDVEGGWMMSLTHRSNVLNARFEDIGVGVAYGAFEGTSTIIVVQMFGTPEEKNKQATENKLQVRSVKQENVARVESAVPVERVATATVAETVLGVTVAQEVVLEPRLRADQLDVFREGATVVNDVQNQVRATYLFVIVYLLGGLLVLFAYRLHLQKASVIAHTVGVIGLAMVLMLV